MPHFDERIEPEDAGTLGEFAREVGVLRDGEFVEEKTVRQSRPLRSLLGRPSRRDRMDDLLEMGIIVDSGRRRNGRPVYVITPLGKKLTGSAELIGRAAARRWDSPS